MDKYAAREMPSWYKREVAKHQAQKKKVCDCPHRLEYWGSYYCGGSKGDLGCGKSKK